MNKRTHKFRALGADAINALATSGSLAEAAQRLGVDRTTLHRWMRAGKLAPMATPAKRAADTKLRRQVAARRRRAHAKGDPRCVLMPWLLEPVPWRPAGGIRLVGQVPNHDRSPATRTFSRKTLRGAEGHDVTC